MPALNFPKAIEKVKYFLTRWENRCLTPFGKITLIKTNILSKFIHLFSSLPTPKCYLDEINNIIYKFLWDNKPDKIKRDLICSDYLKGGLKMVNIYNFVKGIKVAWVRNLSKGDNQQWFKLFEKYHGKMFVDYMWKVGGDWYNANGKHTGLLNNFWLEVFNSWKILCKLQKVASNSDIMQSCIWHNVNISKTPLYLKIGFNVELFKWGTYLTQMDVF